MQIFWNLSGINMCDGSILLNNLKPGRIKIVKLNLEITGS